MGASSWGILDIVLKSKKRKKDKEYWFSFCKKYANITIFNIYYRTTIKHHFFFFLLNLTVRIE